MSDADYGAQNLLDVKHAASSWGHAPEQISVKAKLKYKRILGSVATTGEIAALGLMIAILIALIWFLFFINFGNIVFDDGTMFHCVLDGLSGDIYAPKQQ